MQVATSKNTNQEKGLSVTNTLNYNLKTNDMEKVFGVINEKTQEISCINFNSGQFADEVTLCLGKEYEVKVENGKTIVAKKKPKYPRTYEECCKVLFEDTSYAEFTFVPAKIASADLPYVKGDFVTALPSKVIPYEEKLNILYKLLICRDAYWKIAGEEIRLDKPWEPDWNESNPKYTIVVMENKLVVHHALSQNHILAFPTEKMRDAFYENFQELINSCKELL